MKKILFVNFIIILFLTCNLKKFHYEIIHIETLKNDKLFAILINPVNLNNDNFKSDIKSFVKLFIKKNGDKLKIFIFDDKETLDIFLKVYNSGDLATLKERLLFSKHYIAEYEGIFLGRESYKLSFFKGAHEEYSPETYKYKEEFILNPF